MQRDTTVTTREEVDLAFSKHCTQDSQCQGHNQKEKNIVIE